MEKILNALSEVEHLAKATKIRRFLRNPANYCWAILFRKIIYPKTRKPARETCSTFFGTTMVIDLPAGTDIYLTGGKSHDSEVRLARYLINNLKAGDHFLDIGAHFGYFSLLAAHLVGQGGLVKAYEASPMNFNLLNQNTASIPQVKSYSLAVSDQPGEITFYQFPIQFSEYNSRHVSQYQQEAWYQNYKPEKLVVPATSLDFIGIEESFIPNIIKIDVEGGEYPVIKGGTQLFAAYKPVVIMEYLAASRNNDEHQKAYQLLLKAGYAAFVISEAGDLLPCFNPDQHLETHQLDSDNLVFCKA